MKSLRWSSVVALAIACVIGSVARGQQIELYAVQFPERQTVAMQFARLAPEAVITADVTFRDKQSRINLAFKRMRPAGLYGGDVTSYVVWAVSPDGKIENLGELWIGSSNGKAAYTSGLKFFGLMVTAEPYDLVDRPSSLVLFHSLAPKKRTLQSRSFALSELAAAPAYLVKNITDCRHSGETPLDLLQAQRVYELAQAMGVERFAADTLREAQVVLGQAKNFSA